MNVLKDFVAMILGLEEDQSVSNTTVIFVVVAIVVIGIILSLAL